MYDSYAKWEKDGTTAAIHDLLGHRARTAAGRGAQPRTAIIDSQSIRTSANVAESLTAHRREQEGP